MHNIHWILLLLYMRFDNSYSEDPKLLSLATKLNLFYPSHKTATFFRLSCKTPENANMIRCRKNYDLHVAYILCLIAVIGMQCQHIENIAFYFMCSANDNWKCYF